MPGNFRAMIHHAVRGERADVLDNRHFILTLAAALMLHMLGIVIYNLTPSVRVMEIPVRALNIKLGDGDEATPDEMKLQPDMSNKADVENTISKLVRDQKQQEQKPPEPPPPPPRANPMDKTPVVSSKIPSPGKARVVGKFNVRSEGVSTAAPVMEVTQRQFVRDLAVPAPAPGTQVAGNIPGNSKAENAEIISRYEQQISLWIEKFKIYPDEARTEGMQGETTVRIRINRRGTIHYYELDHSTGYQPLDRAAIDMIRRANPVPAVPVNYPPGDMLEFLIPVSFHLE